MRIHILSRLIGATLAAVFSTATCAQTHCSQDEIDYFSCRIAGSGKVASLCGGNDSGQLEDAWLQYRFGKPKKVEFEYPATRANSLKQFQGTHFSRYSYLTVLFINGKALYEIELRDDYSAKGRRISGAINVEVEKKRTTLRCDRPVKESSWDALLDLIPATYQPTGDGRDSFLWQYHNRIAK
ncbi:MAG: hypothetical protein H6R10_2342 [Rhodocyclaceae bacterium]|nr:hypothetical protein [Rhodocyclaceae bacterium]